MDEEQDTPLDTQRGLASSLEERKKEIIARHQREWAALEKRWRLRKQADRRAAREPGEPAKIDEPDTWDERKG